MNPVFRLFATVDSFAPTILRLVLALVFTVHGGQKLFGWMGGDGWSSTLVQWTAADGLNFPYWLAVAGIVAEVFGAAGMLLGFMTRLAALALMGVMATAILAVHLPSGFLASKGGYEYPLTLLGITLALLFCGAGRFSVDRLITRSLLPPNTGAVGSYRLSLS